MKASSGSFTLIIQIILNTGSSDQNVIIDKSLDIETRWLGQRQQ